jgi:hypothetical protein
VRTGSSVPIPFASSQGVEPHPNLYCWNKELTALLVEEKAIRLKQRMGCKASVTPDNLAESHLRGFVADCGLDLRQSFGVLNSILLPLQFIHFCLIYRNLLLILGNILYNPYLLENNSCL